MAIFQIWGRQLFRISPNLEQTVVACFRPLHETYLFCIFWIFTFTFLAVLYMRCIKYFVFLCVRAICYFILRCVRIGSPGDLFLRQFLRESPTQWRTLLWPKICCYSLKWVKRQGLTNRCVIAQISVLIN